MKVCVSISISQQFRLFVFHKKIVYLCSNNRLFVKETPYKDHKLLRMEIKLLLLKRTWHFFTKIKFCSSLENVENIGSMSNKSTVRVYIEDFLNKPECISRGWVSGYLSVTGL